MRHSISVSHGKYVCMHVYVCWSEETMRHSISVKHEKAGLRVIISIRMHLGQLHRQRSHA